MNVFTNQEEALEKAMVTMGMPASSVSSGGSMPPCAYFSFVELDGWKFLAESNSKDLRAEASRKLQELKRAGTSSQSRCNFWSLQMEEGRRKTSSSRMIYSLIVGQKMGKSTTIC